MRRFETIKEKIYGDFFFFNHLVLVILAVVGRCGPHLMIVMIFVTQNNLLSCPGISDRLLVFYPKHPWFLGSGCGGGSGGGGKGGGRG